MSRDERLREVRLAVASANPALAMTEVATRAEQIVSFEDSEQLGFDLAAAAAEQERVEDERKERIRRIAHGEQETDGPTSQDLIEDWRARNGEDAGW